MKDRSHAHVQPKNEEELREFYFGLFKKGIPIPAKERQKLVEAGLIRGEKKKPVGKESRAPKGGEEQGIQTDIVRPGDAGADIGASYSDPDREISSDEWKVNFLVGGKIEFPPDFVAWIDSINHGFQHRIPYKNFSKYVQQAEIWMKDPRSLSDYENPNDAYKFLKEVEFPRYRENTLYFLHKHVKIQEADAVSGMMKYISTPATQVIVFLFDNKMSALIGKPRQMFASTTLGGCILKRLLFTKNHFTKFITHNFDKGKEIVNDKIKFPLFELPHHLRPSFVHQAAELIHTGKKIGKDQIKGANSRLMVQAPSITAINGGAPDLVALDEVGDIDILIRMLNEGKPTMYKLDRELGVLVQKRQLFGWGTGGQTELGGGDFKKVFYGLLKQWQDRDFSSGIIPVFFNAFAREGVTKEWLEEQKAFYYNQDAGDEKGESRIQFHQAYPMSIEEMFLTSAKTLIPMDQIQGHVERIYNLPEKNRPVYGYFKPIFDNSKPMPQGMNVPFKVIGAEWMPVSGPEHPMAHACILNQPRRGWINRYYQGTDPTISETGPSNFGSSIWDNEMKNLAAFVRFRPTDAREGYLQSMLLGLYYDCDKELGEGNLGGAYFDYQSDHGHFSRLLANSMLPDHLQGGGSTTGIDKRRGRAGRILEYTKQLLFTYADRIWSVEFFSEVRTYVEKQLRTGTKFEPINKQYHKDDLIDCTTYAYICALCYPHLKPTNTKDAVKVAPARSSLRRLTRGERLNNFHRGR